MEPHSSLNGILNNASLLDDVLFFVHILVLIYGGYWSYKLLKLSPSWKYIWILFIMALFGSALRRFIVCIYPECISTKDWVVVLVIDFIPTLVLGSMGLGLMLLYKLLSKHIKDGKIKK